MKKINPEQSIAENKDEFLRALEKHLPKAEQPEDGAVAWMITREGDSTFPKVVKTRAEAAFWEQHVTLHPLVKVQPLYPESVKAERDALREKVSQLEYSNAVNADAKAQAAKHAEEADQLRERVKELEAHLKRYGSHKSDADGEICEWLKHSERSCTCGLHAAMQEGKS